MAGTALKVGISALFGVLITIFKVFIPTPIDKIVSILPQVLLLVLASLVAGRGSATLTGTVSGLLSAFFRGGALAPFTIGFSILLGAAIDAVLWRGVRSIVKTSILIVLVALIIGFLSFYLTMIVLGLVYIPYWMVAMVFVAGAVESFLGSFIGIKIWKRYFGRRHA